MREWEKEELERVRTRHVARPLTYDRAEQNAKEWRMTRCSCGAELEGAEVQTGYCESCHYESLEDARNTDD